MNAQEFKETMQDIFKTSDDEDVKHGFADDLMCDLLIELGYEEGIRIFRDNIV